MTAMINHWVHTWASMPVTYRWRSNYCGSDSERQHKYSCVVLMYRWRSGKCSRSPNARFRGRLPVKNADDDRIQNTGLENRRADDRQMYAWPESVERKLQRWSP